MSMPAGTPRLRHAVIGVRGVGREHAVRAVSHPGVDLVAVADVDVEAGATSAREFGVRSFADHRELLASGLAESVSIAVPHDLHHPIGLDCLRAGLHVLMEKPLANRVSEADALVREAEGRGVVLAVNHQYRAHRSSRRIAELVGSGAIGTTRRVLWTWAEFRPEFYFGRDPWRTTYERAGGGLLMNQVSHDLDLICWIVGRPIRVAAMVANHLHAAEIEDVASVSVEFENGALGSFQFTMNQPAGFSVRQIQGDRGILVMPDVQSLTYDRDEVLLVGRFAESMPDAARSLASKDAQPTVDWTRIAFSAPEARPRPRGWRARWAARLGAGHRHAAVPSPGAPPVDGISVSFGSFVDAVRNGAEPLASGRSARDAIELVNAILLSAIRHRVVELPLDTAEYDAFLDDLAASRIVVPRAARTGPSAGDTPS